MAIYGDNDGTIPVDPVTDANGDPVEGATVVATLLRGATAVWTDTATTDAAGSVSIAVPDLPMVDPGTTPEAGEVIRGEILVERVSITSGTLNAEYTNDRRVRRRRA